MAGYDYGTGTSNNGSTTRNRLFLSSPLPATLLVFPFKTVIVLTRNIFSEAYRSVGTLVLHVYNMNTFTNVFLRTCVCGFEQKNRFDSNFKHVFAVHLAVSCISHNNNAVFIQSDHLIACF